MSQVRAYSDREELHRLILTFELYAKAWEPPLLITHNKVSFDYTTAMHLAIHEIHPLGGDIPIDAPECNKVVDSYMDKMRALLGTNYPQIPLDEPKMITTGKSSTTTKTPTLVKAVKVEAAPTVPSLCPPSTSGHTPPTDDIATLKFQMQQLMEAVGKLSEISIMTRELLLLTITMSQLKKPLSTTNCWR